MALDIADFISVTTQVAAGAPSKDFGRTLMLTQDDSFLDGGGGGKVKEYRDLSAIGDDFASATEPYLAAASHFGQSPFPKPMLVGRWAATAVNSEIRGGAPAVLAALSGSAVTDGSMRLEETNITGISFALNASYAVIAAAIETALRAANTLWSAADVTFANNQFAVAFAPDIALTGVFSPHSAGTGTDLSANTGLTAVRGATLHLGSAVETVSEALDTIRDFNDNWWGFLVDSAQNGTANMAAAASWARAQRKHFFAESNEVGALVANESATQAAALASAAQSRRNSLTWSRTGDYGVASVAGLFSAVDLTAGDPLPTAKFKSLPGRVVNVISSAQKAELDRKRMNAYVRYGQISMYAEGYALSSNGWIDVAFWLDWFSNEISGRLFNLLRSTPKVGQNAEGLFSLVGEVESVCRIGVRNGGIAGGEVSASMAADIRRRTGDASFDGVLSNGYLIHVGRFSDISQSQRDARESPPLYIWTKGGGAIHFVDVFNTFEQ